MKEIEVARIKNGIGGLYTSLREYFLQYCIDNPDFAKKHKGLFDHVLGNQTMGIWGHGTPIDRMIHALNTVAPVGMAFATLSDGNGVGWCSAAGNRYFIQLPVDEYANTRFGDWQWVLEAVVTTPTDPLALHWDRVLTIIAPAHIAELNPVMHGSIGNRMGYTFLEVNRSSLPLDRPITRNEWRQTILRACAISGDEKLIRVINKNVEHRRNLETAGLADPHEPVWGTLA